MSALRIIEGTSDRYCNTVNEIQQLILNIVSTQVIILHWIKVMWTFWVMRLLTNRQMQDIRTTTQYYILQQENDATVN